MPYGYELKMSFSINNIENSISIKSNRKSMKIENEKKLAFEFIKDIQTFQVFIMCVCFGLVGVFK